MRQKVGNLWLGIGFVFFTMFNALAAATVPLSPIKLGIFPRYNATMTHQFFQPMGEYLSQQLGRPVEIVTAKDFAQFWQGVREKRFDLVHFNQLHYIESHADAGYNVILMNEEFGRDRLAGAFAVRKDSGIKTLQDLKGKRVLFGGDKTAMIAYVVNTHSLRLAGLKAGDYEELFGKNPINATLAAFHKRVDAAGVGDVSLMGQMLQKEGVDVEQMTLIGVGEALPHLPWAVNPALPVDLRDKIQQLLAGLKQTDAGKQILLSARLTGLKVATDAEYDIHRRILESVMKKTVSK